jgi:betaine lipid synthase
MLLEEYDISWMTCVSTANQGQDYLEYRFGTILSVNQRCHLLGFRIPYYVWVGTAKDSSSVQLRLAKVNASATESPFISALDLQSRAAEESQRLSTLQFRSKAYDSAIVNLAASLPLPSAWYQSHHWRIYYDETLQKHRQFNDEYIYAFTWEDDKADERILKINEDDVILAITSAGDNILSYATQRPKRIHAVDLK